MNGGHLGRHLEKIKHISHAWIFRDFLYVIPDINYYRNPLKKPFVTILLTPWGRHQQLISIDRTIDELWSLSCKHVHIESNGRHFGLRLNKICSNNKMCLN